MQALNQSFTRVGNTINENDYFGGVGRLVLLIALPVLRKILGVVWWVTQPFLLLPLKGIFKVVEMLALINRTISKLMAQMCPELFLIISVAGVLV